LHPLSQPQVLAQLLGRINALHGGSGREAAAFVDEVMRATQQAVQRNMIDVERDERALMNLLSCSQSALGRVMAAEVEATSCSDDIRPERSAALVSLLDAILDKYPSSVSFIRFSLSPPTLAGLNTILGVTERINIDVWDQELLPLCRQQLERMQLQGVSGDMFEQTIVDLVREACRIFYIDELATPTSHFGRHLFMTVVEAVRHGYAETERFPACAVQIMTCHSAHGGFLWFREALSRDICHNNKTYNCIREMAFRLLGLVVAADAQPPTPEHVDVMLSVIATSSTPAALVIYRDIEEDAPRFLSPHEDKVESVLRSIAGAVACMLQQQLVDVHLLQPAADFLVHLARRVSPRLCPLLLDVSLRVLALLTASSSGEYWLQSDESLSAIAEKIPAADTVGMSALQEALRVGGEKTRGVVARLVPTLCLSDPHPSVRAVALQALQHDAKLVQEHASLILQAADPRWRPAQLDGDLDVWGLELGLASAQALATLATHHPASLASAVERLVAAAQHSMEHDAMSVPHPLLVAALDRVAQMGESAAVHQVVSTCHPSVLKAMAKLSPSWALLAQQLRGGDKTGRDASYVRLEDDVGDNDEVVTGIPVALSTMDGDTAGPSLAGWREAATGSDPMAALRWAGQVQTTNPDAFATIVEPTLIHEILPRLRHSYERSAESNALEHYDTVAAELSEAMALFPMAATRVLQPTQLLADMQRHVVQHLLHTAGAARARRFLHERGVCAPGLFASIDQWELKRTPVEVETAPTPSVIDTTEIELAEIPVGVPIASNTEMQRDSMGQLEATLAESEVMLRCMCE